MDIYPYQEDFENYLNAIQADLEYDEILLLPLDSCGLCVDQVLEDLDKSQKALSVILSGDNVPFDRIEKTKTLLLKKNLQLIIDKDSKSKYYDLNAFSPILINVTKKEYSYVSLSPENSADFILD